MRLWQGLRRVAVWPLLGLIWVYQRAVSPSIPAIFGPTCSCRYYPTCSQYAAEALRAHGVFVGLVLAVGRLLRCTPFHQGGLDPVPAPGVIKRACRRIHPRSASI